MFKENHSDFTLIRMKSLLLTLLYLISLSYLFGCAQQNKFLNIFLPYLICFSSYLFFIIKYESQLSFNSIIAVGFLIRIISFFSFPHLSEDVYRFWWDGNLINHHLNPFHYTPKEVLTLPILQSAQLENYYQSLNSKEYPSVYPSLSQVYFYLASKASKDQINHFSLYMKFLFLITEFITYWIIYKINKYPFVDKRLFGLIILNPLVLLESYGNLHFELIMVCFLFVGIFLMYNSEFIKSGMAIGFSLVAKLYSLIIIPLLILIHPRKLFQFISPLILISLSMLFFLLPLQESIKGYQLYMHQFEFNSSSFILLSKLLIYLQKPELWYLRGAILYSLFGIIALILIIQYNRTKKDMSSFFKYAFYIFSLFIFCTATIHPWYIIALLIIGLFCFPSTALYASFIVISSYSFYDPFFTEYYDYIRWFEYSSCLALFYIENKKEPLLALTEVLKKQNRLLH